jgi:hypothetical protein
VLAGLKSRYAIDAVQFYDNNFFLNESHARAAPVGSHHDLLRRRIGFG